MRSTVAALTLLVTTSLRLVLADGYGTYSTFDHLGASYSQHSQAAVRYPPKLYSSSSLMMAPNQLQSPPHQHQQHLYDTTTSTTVPTTTSTTTTTTTTTTPAPTTASTTAAPPASHYLTSARQQVTTDSNTTTKVPLYVYNPTLARRLGLSTFMMGSVLYGLSLVPALIALGATSGFPSLSGLLGGLGRRRRRRSTPPIPPLSYASHVPGTSHYKYREMPMLDYRSTRRFLALMANTMEIRKVEDQTCKKYYMCKVYKSAVSNARERPTLSDFEMAIVDTFGIAAERIGFKVDTITEVRNYLDSAWLGMTRGNCPKVFPCLSAYIKNPNGFFEPRSGYDST